MGAESSRGDGGCALDEGRLAFAIPAKAGKAVTLWSIDGDESPIMSGIPSSKALNEVKGPHFAFL
jgi:hypothetical protein